LKRGKSFLLSYQIHFFVHEGKQRVKKKIVGESNLIKGQEKSGFRQTLYLSGTNVDLRSNNITKFI